jgi:hypothetical protein
MVTFRAPICGVVYGGLALTAFSSEGSFTTYLLFRSDNGLFVAFSRIINFSAILRQIQIFNCYATLVTSVTGFIKCIPVFLVINIFYVPMNKKKII